MERLITFLSSIMLVCLIAGLIKPVLFNRLFKKDFTRKGIIIIFGIPFAVLSFILGSITDIPKTNITPEPVVTKNTEIEEQNATSTPQVEEKINIKNPVAIISAEPTKDVAQKPIPPDPAPVAAPAPENRQFKDGAYIVGSEIEPGTYRTRKASSGCYFARLKGFSGSVGDIIANESISGPAVITILATDKGFESRNCGTWSRDLSAISESKTTINNGIFIVDTDIEPGTYRSVETKGCYYSRLRGFNATPGEIIANNIVDTSAIVTIVPSDVGFRSSNCGTWTKID